MKTYTVKTIFTGTRIEQKKEKKEKKYKCPWCGAVKDAPYIICSCEVKDTGMYEFWKY